MDKLQRLYDNEINFEVSCFWDGGIRWGLGDYSNGFTAEGNEPTVTEAIDALCKAAEAKYGRFKQSGEV